MKSLVAALNALSLSGEQQLAAHEEGSHKPDEIALDFDDTLKFWKSRLWHSLSDEQKDGIDAVDAHLSRMSGAQESDLWTEDAVLNHPRWIELRNLAAKAVTLLAPEKN